MPDNRLLIYGAGGFGREVYDLTARNNDAKWNEVIFIDDNCGGRKAFYGTVVMTLEEALATYPSESLEGIVAVGEPALRELLYNKLRQAGIRLATLVDKTAVVSNTVRIGAGSIICEYVTLHSGVTVGEDVLIQPYAGIGHDVEIGNHTILSVYCAPGGGCKFGDRVFVGMQATIKEEISIGNDAIISMGAAVFRDVPPFSTVVGNPARATKGNPEHKIF